MIWQQIQIYCKKKKRNINLCSRLEIREGRLKICSREEFCRREICRMSMLDIRNSFRRRGFSRMCLRGSSFMMKLGLGSIRVRNRWIIAFWAVMMILNIPSLVCWRAIELIGKLFWLIIARFLIRPPEILKLRLIIHNQMITQIKEDLLVLFRKGIKSYLRSLVDWTI